MPIFDKTKPLEEQIDFPVFIGQHQVIFSESKGSFSMVSAEGREEPVTKVKARYAAFLGKYGYVSLHELMELSDTSKNRGLAQTQVYHIKKMLPKDTILVRCSSYEPFLGGYYHGRIVNHRKEYENLRQEQGWQLNIVTGCVHHDKKYIGLLSPLPTEIFRTIMESGSDGIDTLALKTTIYDNNGYRNVPAKFISAHVREIKKSLVNDCIEIALHASEGRSRYFIKK